MNLTQLIKRAIAIRKQYNELEIKLTGKAWQNEQLMEGFVGDVGDLMKLVMAKEGWRKTDNLDAKLKHELADCLWCVLVLADKYDINLEEAFMQTMNELEERIKNGRQ